MKTLDQSNDIGFYRAFTTDGEYIYEWNDLVPSVTIYGDDADFEIESDEWESVTGYSGQHRYSGPIMHPSEQFSSNVLRDMHELDGDGATYALAVVDADDDPDELVGWMILRKKRD